MTSLSSMMTWTLTPPQNRTFLLNHDHSWTRWMIDCERYWTILQKMQHKTATKILEYGECLCLRLWKHLYSWERITQTIYIPSKIQGEISLKRRCSRYLNSWYWNNRMRFLECLKPVGKVLHENSYLWSMMKKSSVSRLQRFTYSQILCYVLERWIRTHYQILLGEKLNWFKSSSQFITLDKIDGEPMELEWNIFPGFTTL